MLIMNFLLLEIYHNFNLNYYRFWIYSITFNVVLVYANVLKCFITQRHVDLCKPNGWGALSEERQCTEYLILHFFTEIRLMSLLITLYRLFLVLFNFNFLHYQTISPRLEIAQTDWQVCRSVKQFCFDVFIKTRLSCLNMKSPRVARVAGTQFSKSKKKFMTDNHRMLDLA